MTDPQIDAARGDHAARLLNDPLLRDAFDQVRQGIHEAWARAPLRDREGQHELKLMLKLLHDVEANLQRVVENGKLARLEIERQRTLRHPFGR